jgi:hypothetical protein
VFVLYFGLQRLEAVHPSCSLQTLVQYQYNRQSRFQVVSCLLSCACRMLCDVTDAVTSDGQLGMGLRRVTSEPNAMRNMITSVGPDLMSM